MKPVRIIIFAKAPVPGRVKTRLIPALGALGAAQLARRMLGHAVGAALAAGIGTVELCAAPQRTDPAWQDLALPGALVWSDQGEGGLGERMARAASRAVGSGEAVLLIGTDCPALDAHALQAAARALVAHDAVMVPTADGGYALLGLNRFDPAIFNDICWSTATVAGATLNRISALGWRVHQRPTVHDIDEPADLRWIPSAWQTVLESDRPGTGTVSSA